MPTERARGPKSDSPADPALDADGRHSGFRARSGAEADEPSPDADVDLTVEQKNGIDALLRQLETVDLYELLGVPRGAEKKEIKRAYNERATKFHPDRFFRKRLGSFKQKMETIFSRMTEALDTLCSPERRAHYDVVLRSKRTRSIEAMLAEAAAEMTGAQEEAECERFVVQDIEVAGASLPPVPPTVRPLLLPSSVPDRRDALAYRLTGRRMTKLPGDPKK